MKRNACILAALAISAVLTIPAGALEYTFGAPDGPDFGTPTSIEVVQTADRGEAKNEDRSKNAALIPPAFGSATSDLPGSGDYLTPNLAPGGMPVTGAVIGGSTAVVYPSHNTTTTVSGNSVSSGFTEVTDDLYYSSGYLGTLKIPAIDLSVKIYQGTDSKTLAKGAGHFEETSFFNGNMALKGGEADMSNQVKRTRLKARDPPVSFIWTYPPNESKRRI